ncbi:hypothetical protein B188_05860 [Candidatus Brocadiaceae bacterium B188]|nr:hypothetical protein B188_05860 [Candidatus Brocadiaceae bacterium B188]
MSETISLEYCTYPFLNRYIQNFNLNGTQEKYLAETRTTDYKEIHCITISMGLRFLLKFMFVITYYLNKRLITIDRRVRQNLS